MALAALVYVTAMALFTGWDAPGFGLVVAMAFGLGSGLAGARNRPADADERGEAAE
jgi:hypothetical protein